MTTTMTMTTRRMTRRLRQGAFLVSGSSPAVHLRRCPFPFSLVHSSPRDESGEEGSGEAAADGEEKAGDEL